MLHPFFVPLFVSLSSWRLDGRSFFRIEHPKLNTGVVDRFAHETAESIDLTYDMALADTADGRVAAHLTDSREVHCQEEGLAAHLG